MQQMQIEGNELSTTLFQQTMPDHHIGARPFRWLRLLILLMLFALLGSCSTARLAYSNADTVVYWWLDGYVDFRSSQKAKTKQDIVQLLSWHRSTQLPQYVQTLTQLQSKLASNPSPLELEASFQQVEQYTQAIALKVLPELTDFALAMDASQKAHLTRKFEKNNEDFREKYLELTPEKQAKTRFKKLVNQADDWLGSVSREQEAIIARYLEKHPPNYAQWLEDSQSHQREVLQLLSKIQNEKPNREVAQAMIQAAILANFERSDSNEQRTQADTSRAAIQQLMADMIRTSSQEQKAHAHKKLQGWIDDCKYLIARK